MTTWELLEEIFYESLQLKNFQYASLAGRGGVDPQDLPTPDPDNPKPIHLRAFHSLDIHHPKHGYVGSVTGVLRGQGKDKRYEVSYLTLGDALYRNTDWYKAPYNKQTYTYPEHGGPSVVRGLLKQLKKMVPDVKAVTSTSRETGARALAAYKRGEEFPPEKLQRVYIPINRVPAAKRYGKEVGESMVYSIDEALDYMLDGVGFDEVFFMLLEGRGKKPQPAQQRKPIDLFAPITIAPEDLPKPRITGKPGRFELDRSKWSRKKRREGKKQVRDW